MLKFDILPFYLLSFVQKLAQSKKALYICITRNEHINTNNNKNFIKMKLTKNQKSAKFNTLMNEINKNYTIGKKVYFDTLEGKVLGEIIEHNPSAFFGSCSVVCDLGNGKFQTQMFTINDI